MRSIGIRELKEQTSRVLRQVRENAEVVEVTYRGRAVARLIPVRPRKSPPGEAAAVWSDLDRLAAEIGTAWPKGHSAADTVREGRRP